MTNQKMLRAASPCGAAAILLTTIFLAAILVTTATPVEACGFLDSLFGCGSQPAPIGPTMCPPIVSSGCAPCAQQTVQYMPRTAYRTFYRRAPVYPRVPVQFSYPVTTWRVMAPCAPSWGTSCQSCGNGSMGAMGTYGGTVGAGCSSCQSGVMGVPLQEATPAPTTFQEAPEEPQPAPQTLQRPIEPVPDPGATRYTPSTPQRIAPDNRVPLHATSREVRPVVHFQTISRTPVPVSVYRAPINDGGWRASHD